MLVERDDTGSRLPRGSVSRLDLVALSTMFMRDDVAGVMVVSRRKCIDVLPGEAKTVRRPKRLCKLG